MNELRIAAAKNSPEILLSRGGLIRIKGRSVHENALEFFKPVDDWVNDYINEPADVKMCIRDRLKAEWSVFFVWKK